jgi:hypothetical protein
MIVARLARYVKKLSLAEDNPTLATYCGRRDSFASVRIQVASAVGGYSTAAFAAWIIGDLPSIDQGFGVKPVR